MLSRSKYSTVLFNGSILPILSREDILGNKILALSSEGFVNVGLPSIANLSEGGVVKLWHPEIAIYKFSNAEVVPYSDCVYLGTGLIWDKICHETGKMEIPTDQNIIAFKDSTLTAIEISKPESCIQVECGYSCFSAVNTHWSHFMFENLPRILALRDLCIEPIHLLFPETDDQHLITLIKHAIAGKDGIELVQVPANTTVRCKRLYWCSMPAYLCNHAPYVHMSAIVIPDWTRKVLKDFFVYLSSLYNDLEYGQKIYISRGGAKRVNPYEQQLQQVFTESGYLCIEPHLLTFRDKARLFTSASHIAGAASSGFANSLFSHRDVNLMMFTNYQRCFDTLLSQMQTVYSNMSATLILAETLKTTNNDAGFILDKLMLKNFLLHLSYDFAISNYLAN